MKPNQWLAVILAGVGVFMYFRGNSGGTDRPMPTDTAGIAERIHRDRAAKQAVIYRDIADRVENGQLADAPAAGTELVSRIAELEAVVAKPLSDDAAKHLPEGEWSDKAASVKWFREAAEGFDRVAK